MDLSEIIGYHFCRTFYADVRKRLVLRDGQAVHPPLTGLEFRVLLFFLENPGVPISRNSVTPLNDVFRSGRHPTDDYIFKIKRKLHFLSKEGFSLVRNYGYTFIGDVSRISALDELRGSDVFQISRLHYNQHSVSAMQTALSQALEASRINPNGLPQALIDAAYLHINLSHAMHAAESPSTAIPKAREAAGRVRALGGHHEGLACGVLGLISLIYDYDWVQADKYLNKALELSPKDAASMLSYAHLLLCSGHGSEACQIMDQAVAVDPTDEIIQASRGWIYTLSGDIHKGSELSEQAAALFPELPAAHFMLGHAHQIAGRYDSALGSYKRALELETTPGFLGALGHLHAVRGEQSLAKLCLEQIDSLVKENRIVYVPGYCRALIYAGLRENEKCIGALQTAYEQKCSWLYQLRVDPRWNEFVSEAEIKKLIKKVGIPPS